MKCGLLVCAAAALSSSPVLAQSVYVAPGGVYIASARVIVAPGGGAPYVAPDAPPAAYDGPGYGPGYAAPAPTAYVDPGYAAPDSRLLRQWGLSAAPSLRCSRLCSSRLRSCGLSAARAGLWLCGAGSRLRRARLWRSGLWCSRLRCARLWRSGLSVLPATVLPATAAPGYGAPGYAAPGYGPPLATRASYGRPAVYAERRLTNVNAYAAEGPPRPPAAIPRVRQRPLRRQSRQRAVGGLQLSGSHRTTRTGPGGRSQNEPPSSAQIVRDRPQRGVSPIFVFAGPAAGEARNSTSARAAVRRGGFFVEAGRNRRHLLNVGGQRPDEGHAFHLEPFRHLQEGDVRLPAHHGVRHLALSPAAARSWARALRQGPIS